MPGKWEEGVRGSRKHNQVILLHITKVRATQYSESDTNDYQPPSNLFCLRTGTICDCMLIITLCHLPVLGYLLRVLQ